MPPPADARLKVPVASTVEPCLYSTLKLCPPLTFLAISSCLVNVTVVVEAPGETVTVFVQTTAGMGAGPRVRVRVQVTDDLVGLGPNRATHARVLGDLKLVAWPFSCVPETLVPNVMLPVADAADVGDGAAVGTDVGVALGVDVPLPQPETETAIATAATPRAAVRRICLRILTTPYCIRGNLP